MSRPLADEVAEDVLGRLAGRPVDDADVLAWKSADDDARAAWAATAAAGMTAPELRAAILATSAGRGPLALSPTSSARRSVNLSRAACLKLHRP